MGLIRKTKKIVLLFSLIIFSLTATSCNAETNSDSDGSFPVFWKKFRSASLNNDMDAILKMTRFPFVVKGDLDMNGVVSLNKIKFKNQFNKFLNQDIRENLTPESMRSYIKKNKQVSPIIEDGQTTLGLFSFELINGTWLFVRAYVE